MITSEEQLRSLYAMPAERALLKQQVDLDRHCLRFIALSPLCIVATGGAAGSLMDASPRGGKPGFVKAPDNQTLLIPDSGGNNRLDSFSNLIADPRIGLLFMVPGFDETLRINGTAQLRDEAHYTALFANEGFGPRSFWRSRCRRPICTAPRPSCAPGSGSPESQVPRNVMPSVNQMVHQQIGLPAPTETQEAMVERYEKQIAGEQGL